MKTQQAYIQIKYTHFRVEKIRKAGIVKELLHAHKDTRRAEKQEFF